MSYLLLLDINAAWVRSLFAVYPGLPDGSRSAIAWRVWGFHYWLTNQRQLRIRHEGVGKVAGLCERDVLVPSWNWCGRLSTWSLVRRIRRVIARHGQPEAIVYTLPQYAGIADRFRELLQVYYAYDAYRFYSRWDSSQIDSMENRILNSCNIAFAVSRQLQEDLQARTKTPVHYSPNAVSLNFAKKLATPVEACPADLRNINGKVVGCVGQISESGYDWNLIDELVALLPDVNFVFIGPLHDDPPGSRRNIERTFKKPNVHWLGAKRHAELPDYIARFDVCFGPYPVNAIKNRGSPLRMYDYLCTNKGVLFTPIREVFEHRELLEVGATPAKCAQLIRRMIAATYKVAQAKRRQFIEENTWERRAESIYRRIEATRMNRAIAVGQKAHLALS